jgi:glycosyltransferase involved in cell wall biosynthesis
MPPITALLQTHNDAHQLGRALESLRPCDEILIVDHGSTDSTLRIAREYGASIRNAPPNTSINDYLAHARCEWIFCLLPSETLTNPSFVVRMEAPNSGRRRRHSFGGGHGEMRGQKKRSGDRNQHPPGTEELVPLGRSAPAIRSA